jgi:type VI secretion system protein ImpH
MGTDFLTHRLSIGDVMLQYYVNLFASKNRSAVGLKQLLSDYFKLPIEVYEFQGKWLYLGKENLSAIESRKILEPAYQQIGKNFILGHRCWSVQSQFRVYIGPVFFEQFSELTAGKTKINALIEIIRFYAGIELDFDLQIELVASEVPFCCLQSKKKLNSLGWNMWLMNKRPISNVKDVIVRPNLNN